MNTYLKNWTYRDTGLKFRTYFDGKTLWYALCDAANLNKNSTSSRDYRQILKLKKSDPRLQRAGKLLDKDALKSCTFGAVALVGTYELFRKLLSYYSSYGIPANNPMLRWFDEVFIPNLSLTGHVNPKTEYVPVDPKLKVETTDLLKIMEYITLLEGILDKFGVKPEDKPIYCNGLIKNVFGIDLMGKCVHPVTIAKEGEVPMAAFDALKLKYNPQALSMPKELRA